MSKNSKSCQSGIKNSTPEEYISMLEISNDFTEKTVRQAIKKLGLFPGCEILDIPCGIGNHSCWMIEENETVNVIGVDISEEHLAYANKLSSQKRLNGNISFEKGNLTNLSFKDNSFDFIWCCNGLWIGSPDLGCIATEPYQILNELKRVTRPGGKIALIFWSGQKLLPGYPLLESVLNATFACHYISPDPPDWIMDPDVHIMRAPFWLKKMGLKNVKADTFVTDIRGPFSIEKQKNITRILDMFWGRAENEVTPKMWEQYKSISEPNSDDFIFRMEEYAGFITYTMFTGEVI